jgi:hypothetical protein
MLIEFTGVTGIKSDPKGKLLWEGIHNRVPNLVWGQGRQFP